MKSPKGKEPLLAQAWADPHTEAGCDEAGRGCLAGPVFGAAVVLGDGHDWSFVQDSKRLSPEAREEAATAIRRRALGWAVGWCPPAVIDQLNILNASFQAIHHALDQLPLRPQCLLMDGNRFHSYQDIPHRCFVGGDGRFVAIAAASILAKTERDRYMRWMHGQYPVYGWDSNKGYPTKAHKEAIRRYGASPLHRRSFRWG
jgi:ribonuclease HII